MFDPGLALETAMQPGSIRIALGELLERHDPTYGCCGHQRHRRAGVPGSRCPARAGGASPVRRGWFRQQPHFADVYAGLDYLASAAGRDGQASNASFASPGGGPPRPIPSFLGRLLSRPSCGDEEGRLSSFVFFRGSVKSNRRAALGVLSARAAAASDPSDLAGSAIVTESSWIMPIVVGLSALIIGVGKGGLGVAFGALATPVMALVLPVQQVLPMVLVIQMVADVFAVGVHWKRWDSRLVKLLIPGAIVGVALGTLFITRVSAQTLRTTLAVVILLFTAYKLAEKRLLRGLAYRPRGWHSLVAGGISGLTSAVANNGGPPVTIYLLMYDLQPRVFIGTTALFFLILNYIKLPFYFAADLFDWQQLVSIVWALPLAPIGVWIGRAFVLRVNKEQYDRVILVFLAISAVLVLLS